MCPVQELQQNLKPNRRESRRLEGFLPFFLTLAPVLGLSTEVANSSYRAVAVTYARRI